MSDTEIYKVVIEALEKQVPKKPTSWWEYTDEYVAECPSCDSGVSGSYCSYCGQRISWVDWNGDNDQL